MDEIWTAPVVPSWLSKLAITFGFLIICWIIFSFFKSPENNAFSVVAFCAVAICTVAGAAFVSNLCWNCFNSFCGTGIGACGAVVALIWVNKKGLSNKTFPKLFSTSTAPGLNPNELSGPGPIRSILLWELVASTVAWNSVPLVPIVPAGTLISKLAGFFSLTPPVSTFMLPFFICDKIFPSFVLGS